LSAAGVGVLLVYPLNLWMGRRGVPLWPEPVSTDERDAGGDSENTLSVKKSWGALLISIVLLAGWLAWIAVNAS
jgi:hypothetical protein